MGKPTGTQRALHRRICCILIRSARHLWAAERVTTSRREIHPARSQTMTRTYSVGHTMQAIPRPKSSFQEWITIGRQTTYRCYLPLAKLIEESTDDRRLLCRGILRRIVRMRAIGIDQCILSHRRCTSTTSSGKLRHIDRTPRHASHPTTIASLKTLLAEERGVEGTK